MQGLVIQLCNRLPRRRGRGQRRRGRRVPAAPQTGSRRGAVPPARALPWPKGPHGRLGFALQAAAVPRPPPSPRSGPGRRARQVRPGARASTARLGRARASRREGNRGWPHCSGRGRPRLPAPACARASTKRAKTQSIHAAARLPWSHPTTKWQKNLVGQGPPAKGCGPAAKKPAAAHFEPARGGKGLVKRPARHAAREIQNGRKGPVRAPRAALPARHGLKPAPLGWRVVINAHHVEPLCARPSIMTIF